MVVELDEARSVLAKQPFSQLVGARLELFAPGEAVLAMDIAEHHLQQFGLVHGGVLAYAADNALTFAAGSVLGPSVLTAGLTISYLRAARGGTLRAHATVAHQDRRQAVCAARVVVVPPEGGAAILCAIAQGTILATGRDSGA